MTSSSALTMKYLTYLRLASIGLLLYSTFSLSIQVHISWQTAVSFGLFLVSFYVFRRDVTQGPDPWTTNPFKKTKSQQKDLTDLTDDQIRKIEHVICDHVTYDAEDTGPLRRFAPLKQQSQCVFARQARIWAADDWVGTMSLEENIRRCVPTFYKFILVCPELALDGFLFELPPESSSDMATFADSVLRTLTVLSDHDPAGYHCMNKSFIGKKEWVFQFNKMTFFVTTFAPFYPENHPRFAFGCNHGYILLQPELSFAFKDLPPDTPLTNWERPLTVRDRIRVAFRDAGRPYKIRETIFYPMAEDLVRPLRDSDPVVEWWVPNKQHFK